MSDTELLKFQQCLEQARGIVAAYRSEAPEGCDPQNTWVAVGVLVVKDVVARSESGDWFGVQGGIFGSGEEAGAGGAGGAGGKGGKNGKGAFDPLAIPEPAEINYASPEEVLGRWRGEVTSQFPQYSAIANNLNVDEQNAARTANQMSNANYYGLLGNLSNKATDYANGKIPEDVKRSVLNNANESAYLKGFAYGGEGGGGNTYAGGNDAGANLALKNLGLTTLDLSKFGLGLTQNALDQSRASRGRIISATDVIPTQGFFADQMNKQSEGEYMNEQNQNNYEAAVKNAPQQAAYNQLLFRSNMMNNQAAQANAKSAAQGQQMNQILGMALQAYGSYASGGSATGAAASAAGSAASTSSTAYGATGSGATNYYGGSPYNSETAGSFAATQNSTYTGDWSYDSNK